MGSSTNQIAVRRDCTGNLGERDDRVDQWFQTTQHTGDGAVTMDLPNCCANCIEPPTPSNGSRFTFLASRSCGPDG